MASILDDVDRRTKLAGSNRMELLLFRLKGKQRYGINVFKVQEVIQCPPLTRIPHSSPVIRGVAHMRGKTVPVMDLRMAIGMEPIGGSEKAFVIVSEYNRSVQGFLVSAVERIVNMNWEEIQPPPRCAGKNSYLTAVTKIEDEIIEIIDVEKVLSEITRVNNIVSEGVVAGNSEGARGVHVLVADDSAVARNQIKRTLEQLEIEHTLVNDGKQAFNVLQDWLEEKNDNLSKLAMVISDIEMPEMDGYTLTAEIRKNPELKNLFVLLHTSMSGVFNEALVDKVGADLFIPKFKPDDLAEAVIKRVQEYSESNGA